MHKEPPLSSLQTSEAEDEKKPYPIIFVGIICTLLLCLLYLLSPAFFQHFDYRIYDIFLTSFPESSESSKPVIVDLDEQSLKQYGQWPWPRYRVAELLKKINIHEPASITLDIIFSEPDGTSLGPLLKNISDTFNLDAEIKELPKSLLDNDQIFSDVLAEGPFILATKFHFDDSLEKSDDCVLHPVTAFYLQNTAKPLDATSIFSADSVLCNIHKLSTSVSSSGFFNISPDRDGILRRAPLLIKYQNRLFPSLALATLMKSTGTDQLKINVSGGRLENIQFDGHSIPVDPNGDMLIKFRGPKNHYDYISATDILNNNIEPQRLKDKIVFVGTSAAGLKELRATPFDPVFPGVEVHATIVDNIITGDFLRITPWVSGLVFVLVLLLGTISTIILAKSKSIWGALFTCLSILFLWFGARWLFHENGFFFPLTHLIVSIVFIYLILTVFKYRLEERKVLAGTKELLLTQDTTIETMATLAECRDPETGGHIKRTREYIKILAEKLQKNPKYINQLNESVIDMLYKSAPLHDIGKVGVPDNILLKPARLSEDEFEIMKNHTLIGRDVIKAAEGKLGKGSFLKFAEEMAYTHQEKWDGSGYPQGLKGEEIPIRGRLMALADVYDALISKRPYKKPYSHSEAINTIQISSGTHFDPDIVDAFLEIKEEFRKIALTHADFEIEREMLIQ